MALALGHLYMLHIPSHVNFKKQQLIYKWLHISCLIPCTADICCIFSPGENNDMYYTMFTQLHLIFVKCTSGCF